MNKLLSVVCSDKGRQFRSIYGNSLSRGSFVLGHFLSSLVVPLYRYLIRRKGGRERNQALLSMRPRETLPHQTKWVRPRRASLGIFNTAGYEVLIALFLTSQIPFSISLLPVLFPFILFHSFFVSPFKLPVSLSQFSFLPFVARHLCTVSPSLF